MTTEERITILESRLDDLQKSHDLISAQLNQARIEQWQARIDDLELQVHLGAADARDRLDELTTELSHRWSKVRQQLGIATATTSEVTETLRGGLESAYKNLRDALIESRKQLH